MFFFADVGEARATGNGWAAGRDGSRGGCDHRAPASVDDHRILTGVCVAGAAREVRREGTAG